MAAASEALATVSAPAPGPDSGIVPSSGSFSLRLVVEGGPEGTRRIVLGVESGAISLTEDPDEELPADVIIALGWADAVALFDGALSAPEAITQGKIRVRGDLSVLVAGQELLVAAAPALAGLRGATEH